MRTMLRAMTVCAAALLLLAAGSAFAADQVWTAGSSNYNTPGNWSGGAKPVAGDSATFTNPTYTVNFTGAEASKFVQVTGTAANVTFNLGGNTYTLNNAGSKLYVGSNATDNVKLTITGGTVDATGGANGPCVVIGANGSAGTLVVDNSSGTGGRLLTAGKAPGVNAWILNSSGTLIISGSGSYMSGDNYAATISGTLIVTNGGAMTFPDNVGAWGAWNGNTLITGTGSALTNSTSSYNFNANGSFQPTLRIESGGLLYGAFYPGLYSGSGTSTAIVGNAVGTSVMNVDALTMGYSGGEDRGSPFVIVNAGGTIRARNTTGNSIYISDIYATGGTLTMNGGAIEMAGGANLEVANYGANTSHALLRGSGTITRFTGTSNFSISNEGYLRVGDTNDTPSMGTLFINGGNLYQTNSANKAKTYFEFGATAYDQINIANGLAKFTTGTNTFSLAAAAPTPVHGVKYGLGVYDFIIATNITYNVSTMDNLTYLLTNTYHLTYNVDFTYGVVPLVGGLFALELQFVPEPSTFLLLGLGGLMVWRRMAKRGKIVASNQ